MGEYLITDLASQISFAAGGVVSGSLTIKAPEDAEYYILIEQYTSALAFLPGTREYLYQAVVGGTAEGSTVNYTTYELDEDEEKDVDFGLTLAYTNCYLYLFLKKMAGATPDPDTDETVDYATVTLNPVVEEVPALDINSLIMMIIPVMMIAMVIPIALKD